MEISNPNYRSKIFGFLHALDVGGGLIAVIYSIVLVLLQVPLREIILLTMIPLFVSSLSLALARTGFHELFVAREGVSTMKPIEKAQDPNEQEKMEEKVQRDNFVYKAILLSATFFGFSYYALGFPIVTVARSQGSAVLGIVTFGIYLGVSALAGFSLGSLRGKRPFRTLWSFGYVLAAISSLVIGLSFSFHYNVAVYYLGAAGLGFATGSVETFEPVLISTLVKSSKLSSGLGWLSSTRALGLFVSNIVMGVLFVFSEFDSYLYAALTALVAGSILALVEIKTRMK